MKKPKMYFNRLFAPIKSLADAEQKKKDVKKLLIVSAIVFGVGLVLSFIAGIFKIIYYVGIVGFLVCGFLTLVIKRDSKKFKFLTCDSCKTQASITTYEDFEKYVEYEILEVIPKFAKPYTLDSKTPGIYDTLRVDASIIVKGRISLKCANCGTTKTGNFVVVPFRCNVSEREITYDMSPKFVELMSKKINIVLEEWLDEENEYDIPLTKHSIYHPDREEGSDGTIVAYNGSGEMYKDVHIVYSRCIDEMIEGYFLRNEYDCQISLPEDNASNDKK